MSLPLTISPDERSTLASVIDSDCRYFEMGAELRQLDGAAMAWMPGLTRSPAAAVIHRVEAGAIARGGEAWIADAEAAMVEVGASLCRIYLEGRHDGADDVLRRAGYVSRDELAFVDALPAPTIDLTLRAVESEADWAAKLRFHLGADETPDGHDNPAHQWVELERRKCAAGMQAFLAELGGELVGAAGAIWCDSFVRTKNLVVAPARRRQGIGRAILGSIAALGRQRGLSRQCVLAVRGDQGEHLYRALGMAMIGYQVEWSKPLGGGSR